MCLWQIRRRKNGCLILVCQLASKFFMSSRRDHFFFFCLLIHIRCLSANYLLSVHLLPALGNIPTFAFLMCFIIPPHITLSATYFTFRQAHGLLLNFFNSVVNGERSSISFKSKTWCRSSEGGRLLDKQLASWKDCYQDQNKLLHLRILF